MDADGGAAKINHLDEILEDVVSDTTELAKDLNWSVKTYLLFGLIMILFGISEIAYNAEVLQERYYLPLFITGALFFAGAAQIYQYVRLKKKYARLLGIRNELERT